MSRVDNGAPARRAATSLPANARDTSLGEQVRVSSFMGENGGVVLAVAHVGDPAFRHYAMTLVQAQLFHALLGRRIDEAAGLAAPGEAPASPESGSARPFSHRRLL